MSAQRNSFLRSLSSFTLEAIDIEYVSPRKTRFLQCLLNRIPLRVIRSDDTILSVPVIVLNQMNNGLHFASVLCRISVGRYVGAKNEMTHSPAFTVLLFAPVPDIDELEAPPAVYWVHRFQFGLIDGSRNESSDFIWHAIYNSTMI